MSPKSIFGIISCKLLWPHHCNQHPALINVQPTPILKGLMGLECFTREELELWALQAIYKIFDSLKDQGIC